MAALRRAVRKRGGPLASIDVADGLLDDAASGPEAADQSDAWVMQDDSRVIYADFRLPQCDSIRITLQLLVIGRVPR